MKRDSCEMTYRLIDTAAGCVGIVGTERGLRRVYLPLANADRQRQGILRDFPSAAEDSRLLPGLCADLRRYFRGDHVEFDVELDVTGYADFHVDVWNACRRISFGRTDSYGTLAQRVGRPGAARAVGTAMARNPFPVVVPCHRVLKSDGSIGGYSGVGGLTFKRRLLQMESAAVRELLPL